MFCIMRQLWRQDKSQRLLHYIARGAQRCRAWEHQHGRPLEQDIERLPTFNKAHDRHAKPLCKVSHLRSGLSLGKHRVERRKRVFAKQEGVCMRCSVVI